MNEFMYGLTVGFLLVGLVLRISVRRETELRRIISMEAQTVNDLQAELWRINADVMCRNYECGCLRLTEACIARDRKLAAQPATLGLTA